MIFNTNEYSAKSVYIGVSIGGMSLTSIPPKYIKSFSVDKVTSDSEGGGNFSLELIAPNSTFTQGESSNFTFLLNYLLARSLTNTEQIGNDFADQKEDGYNSSITVEYGWLGGEMFVMPNAVVTSCKTGLNSELNSMEFTVSGTTNKIIYDGYCKNFFSIKELAQQKLNSEDIDIDALITFPKEAGKKKLSYVIENLAKFLYGEYYNVVVDHNDQLYTDEKSSILAEFSTNEINKSSLTLFNYLDRLIDACRTYVPEYIIEEIAENRTYTYRGRDGKTSTVTRDVITDLAFTPVITVNGKKYKLSNESMDITVEAKRGTRVRTTKTYNYNPYGNSETDYPFSDLELFTVSSDNKLIVTRAIPSIPNSIYVPTLINEPISGPQLQVHLSGTISGGSVDEVKAILGAANITPGPINSFPTSLPLDPITNNPVTIEDMPYFYLINKDLNQEFPGLADKLLNYYNSQSHAISHTDLTTERSATTLPNSIIILRDSNNNLYAFEELSSEDTANVKSITSGESSKNFKKYFSRYAENGKGTLTIKGETNDVKSDHIFIISNNIPNNTVTSFSLSTDTLPAIAAMASLQNNATTQTDISSGLAITASTDLGGLTANNLAQLSLLQQELLVKLVNVTDSYISDAEMTVIATPKSCSIEITDTIRIIPMINNGNTLFIGDYTVMSVKDTIDSSGFTTSFTLKFAKSDLISDLETLLGKQGVSLESLDSIDTVEQSSSANIDDLCSTSPKSSEDFIDLQSSKQNSILKQFKPKDLSGDFESKELLTATGILTPQFTFVGGTFADTGQVVSNPYIPMDYNNQLESQILDAISK